MSTTFHPAIDGQSERTINTLEDMLRPCAIEFGGSWQDRLDLIEFYYNNNYHTSIGMLWNYISDLSHVLEVENIELDESLTYAEVPKEILDRKVRKIINVESVLLNVLLSNHNVEEATWEPEDSMRERFPHLFDQFELGVLSFIMGVVWYL
ncbi:uncharacterized protein LOC141607603 [Silene latifolia]|uniref:uncharacterized protein LOC141607603 n=1 Tax=Silene latifolia TaxID=37657 RepID=UPI003D773D15